MREALKSSDAPAAIGPYSQAVRAGHFVFLSGQIALDPETGQLVGGDVEAQTHRVMRNLGAILTAAGLSFDHVIRTTVFLADMGDFGKVNEIYGSYFQAPAPARSTVQVARLPRDAKVEIDAIAMRG